MKKIIILLLISLTFSACSKDETINNQINDAESNEVVTDEIEDTSISKYVDDNVIPTGIYHANNGVYTLVDNYNTPITIYKDIASFEVVPSKESALNGKFKVLWKERWESFTNSSNYKIGYNVKFTLIDGRSFNKNVFKWSDAFEYFDYVQTYLYDDIHVPDNTPYSHLEDDNFTSETIITTIKLTASVYIDQVVYPITLSAFTYDSDDFDEDGNYRGNSIYSINIYKS